MEELRGVIDHIVFRNEENGYTVFSVTTEDGDETCTGIIPALAPGESCVLTGEYRETERYGLQFQVTRYEQVRPEGSEAVRHYLSSGAIKGIGPSLAYKIVKRFGDDTLRVLEEEPERLSEVKGISERMAREIALQVHEKKDLRDAMIFLDGYGISNNLAVRIWSSYGEEMYEILRENPYRLADDIDGVGFKTADSIAQRAGIQPDADYRIRSGLLYVMSQAMADGSTYLPEDLLLARTSALLGVQGDCLAIQLRNLVMERRLVMRRLPEEEAARVWLPVSDYEERGIARMLWHLEETGVALPLSGEELDLRLRELGQRLDLHLDEQQAQAVRLSAEHAVFILTGGPGTGKTTTMSTLIRFYMGMNLRVALAAPTGRAARRMTEATGFEARTIHRLLGVRAIDTADEGERALADRRRRAIFERGKDDPLDAEVVIIDEMSMVDMHLFHALLEALRPGTRLILSGDTDQLPCVGPGRVLGDLLDSGCFHSIHLSRIFRQAMESDIVKGAHAILRGELPEMSNNSRDFFFLERSDVQVIYKHIAQLMQGNLTKYAKCSPEEIQVLTPMRKGALGAETLNTVLQEVLNPPSRSKRELTRGERTYREGDKVMQTRNNYQLSWEIPGPRGMRTEGGEGIFNGDFGRIESIDPAAEIVTVLFDEERIVDYPYSELEDLDLAYAVTVHKSQGSEYPAVILPLLGGPQPLLYRNLLYTAVTRARHTVVILGSRDTVRTMVGNTRQNLRFTGLSWAIRTLADL